MSTRSAAARSGDLEEDFGRASAYFSVAHMLAVLTGIATAILLQYSATTPSMGTPAAICLGLTAALILTARHGIRSVLVEEARRKGLVGAQARAYVRDQLARQTERRSRLRP